MLNANKLRIIVWVTAFTLIGSASLTSAFAAVPMTLTQQGRLLGKDGSAIDADLNFVFSIYDVATAGTPLWTETQTITVEEGFFSARLGEKTAFPAGLYSGAKTLYLGIKIGDDAEMTPRQTMTSVPFALKAAEADVAITAKTADTAKSADTAKAVALHSDRITKADDGVTDGHASICIDSPSVSFSCTVAANRKCTSLKYSAGWLVGESDGTHRTIICLK